MNPQIFSSTYEICEQIGSGGGGDIYKAWHVRLQKEVVLKKLRLGTSASRQTQRAETDILKTLKHSYLPQLYDFLIEGEDVYTVMEFIPGQSLDKLLNDGRKFPQHQVIKWAGQLCGALDYLHSQTPPILHSDIKPANVMLTPQGDICLIDFNISLLLDESGAVAVGRSHGYASPEQYSEAEAAIARSLSKAAVPKALAAAGSFPSSADPDATLLMTKAPDAEQLLDETELAPHDEFPLQNDGTMLLIQQDGPLVDNETKPLLSPAKSNVNRAEQPQFGSSTSSSKMILDVRSDVYSLGATLYHLLTGKKPTIATGGVKPLASFGIPFSEGVTYIVEKAMNPDPAKRFQTMGEMLRAVKNIRKLDSRWKAQALKKDIAAILLVVAFAASGLTAFMGSRQLAREKVERYETAVYQLEYASDTREIETLFDYAIGLFPQRIDAFYAKARALSFAGNYDECLSFIEQSLITLHPSPENPADMAKLGDIYYIMSNCYFEWEDYQNAVVYYKAAVEHNHSNAEYYRDYAIALARTGDVREAESVLVTAETMRLSDDSLDLLRGEIAYAKAEYTQAADYFRNTIRISGDNYILYRAYRICADAYKRQNSIDDEIAILTEAKSILPPERINEITERLADAYVRGAQSGAADSELYYQKAAEDFEELLERGYSTFLIRSNLAIVYEQIGDMTAAERLLLELQEDYPQNYRVPMRLAYLYADMQAQLANEQRNYAQTKQCFDKAWELYRQQLKDGNSDPEMLMLEDMISQLAQGGWLSM